MRRRGLLRVAAAIPAMAPGAYAAIAAAAAPEGLTRARPDDPSWPSRADWDRLSGDVGGRLIEVRSPLAACATAPSSPRCTQVFQQLRNPYFLGDEVGLTQTLGWVDAWTSRPSVYAVAAQTTGDVVAAVNFARERNLRLVVKGGGHSYHGTSSAADSLLIWTRQMRAITLHDAFVAAGCGERFAPQPAVTIGAGALWGHTYDEVTTRAGRYVQGGGCLTVGVAGLIQSGGFGSFSKAYGMAASSLLEAEIVTADGQVRIANACQDPDLLWALKGGGGSLGVVTRLTLRTHELPAWVGAVQARISARSDDAFRRLIGHLLDFYRGSLLNPHWGEQIAIQPDNVLAIAMVFQGLDQQEAQAVWQPFLRRIEAGAPDYTFATEPWIVAVPARRFWDPTFLSTLPGVVLADDRMGAPPANLFWAGDQGQVGQVLHGYQSAWIPASLLEGEHLGDALFAASRHWRVSLHVNKGLAGAPAEAVAAAQDTAINPAVLDAFALLISGAEQPPAYPGVAAHEPDVAAGRRDAAAIGKAMGEVRKLLPVVGSYVSEGDFFDERWQEAFWGANYAKLLAVKDRYDPDGLFVVHHGVGSERWSADGFTRVG